MHRGRAFLAVKTQIWIAISVYVLIAIVKKECIKKAIAFSVPYLDGSIDRLFAFVKTNNRGIYIGT